MSKTNRQPAISVLLTTYNRANLLPSAIRSVLRQDFTSYEMLILDDCSPDHTAQVVHSFVDSRIHYIRQEKRNGFTENFRTGIRRARGTYLFLLSDDDMILKADTLSKMVSAMDKYKAGIGAMSILFYEHDPFHPSYRISGGKPHYLPPSKKNILKTIDWHFGFMSGLMYRRNLINMKDIIDDLWVAHLKPLYRILLSHGCYYLGDHYIIAKNSTSGNISHLDVQVNDGYHLLKQLQMYRDLDISTKRYHTFVKIHTIGVAGSFPGIRYFTSIKNTLRISYWLIKIYPQILLSFRFYFYLIIAVVLPKQVLGFVRQIKLKNGQQKITPFIKDIELEKNLRAFIH